MKRMILSILLLFLLVSSVTYAQNEVFKVLASKGSNKVIGPGSSDPKSILIGKKLYKDEKIVIEENSYLGLAHKDGKTIELKKAGTYEVNKLSAEVASQNAGVAKKYVDFIAGEFASADDEEMAKNRHKYMAVTGSVERDIKHASKIKVLTPKDAYVLAAPVTLRWVPAADTNAVYVVTLTNLAEEKIYSVETKDHFASIDLHKLNLKKEKNFLWKVFVKGHKHTESEVAILKYVDDAKTAALEKQVAAIKAELKEETALNKIVLASFYEENNLILDALASYEEAITLEPDVEDYKIAYGKFLERKQLAVSVK